MNAQFIHPNTPPKLVKKFHKAGSYHKLADEIEVNVSYVFDLIAYGKEPNDTTPKLREIRHRLGLRKYKPRNRPKPAPAPKHLIWWNNIGKEMRHKRVKKIYQEYCTCMRNFHITNGICDACGKPYFIGRKP